MSAAAPEFIPNFKPTPNPSGDWNYQAHHQDTPSQVYQQPQPHIYSAPQSHSRSFQQQPQAPYQRNFPVYPQQPSNRNYRPDLIQNHHSHHHQNYSNHHQAPQSQSPYMMMNQQQPHQSYSQQQQQQQGQDGYGLSNIQNRLNFNNSHPPEPVVHEPTPHKQVRYLRIP